MNVLTTPRTYAGVGRGAPHHAGRRGASPVVATAAIALGTVCTAIGLGIGVRHLQVAGVSRTAVVGCGALVIGLALATAGTSSLVRRVGGWRRWLALPVGALVAWFALWPLTVALMATRVPATRLGATTPTDRGLAYDDVTFTASDGVRLSAWYLPSRIGAAVVLRHGATSTRSATLDQAVVLARHGYGVLATDARGHGRSGGTAMDLGWHGDEDVAAAVDFLAARDDVDPDRIAVVGLSMGGEEAIGAAASDPRIRAVVVEGVSGRGVVADDDLVLPRHAGRWLNIGQTWIQQHLTALLGGVDPPRGLRSAVLATAPRRMLLITGGAAQGGEATAGRRLRAASSTSVTLWEVPDAPHTAGLATQPAQWREHVIGFLDGALGMSRGAPTGPTDVTAPAVPMTAGPKAG